MAESAAASHSGPRGGEMRSGANVDDIRAALETMARLARIADFAVEVNRVDALQGGALFPIEIESVPNVGAKRLATFRAGRMCARSALARLGAPHLAIPRQASGAPRWPPGFCGSIAHTQDVAAAIVVRNPEETGIGLDVEDDDPLDSEVSEIVCRREEIEDDLNARQASALQYGKLLFVIKEATYKLFWPSTNVFLEFHSIRVSIDAYDATFSAEIFGDSDRPALWSHLAVGRYASVEGLYAALATKMTPWSSPRPL